MDIGPSDPSVAFRHPRLIPWDLSFRWSGSIIVKSVFGLSRLRRRVYRVSSSRNWSIPPEKEQSEKELPGSLVGFNLVQTKLKTETFRPTCFLRAAKYLAEKLLDNVNNFSRIYTAMSRDVVCFRRRCQVRKTLLSLFRVLASPIVERYVDFLKADHIHMYHSFWQEVFKGTVVHFPFCTRLPFISGRRSRDTPVFVKTDLCRLFVPESGSLSALRGSKGRGIPVCQAPSCQCSLRIPDLTYYGLLTAIHDTLRAIVRFMR